MNDVLSRLSEHEIAELSALADGTLPPDRVAAVEARVAASPELRELVDRQRQAVAATRMLADEPVPDSLSSSLEAQRRARARRRPALRLAPVALAGAVVAAVVVAAVILSGGPGAPTVAEAAQLTARAAQAPAPARRADSATRLAVAVEGVAFPYLARLYGWRAVGVRHDKLDGHSASIVYYAKGRRRLAYVIVSGSGLPRPDKAQATTRAGVQYQTLRIDDRLVVTWRRAGHTCVLIGDAPRAELLKLASWRL